MEKGLGTGGWGLDDADPHQSPAPLRQYRNAITPKNVSQPIIATAARANTILARDDGIRAFSATGYFAAGGSMRNSWTRPVSKSYTSSKSSRRSCFVLLISPISIRLKTISPKSPVLVTPQLLSTVLAM
jgi:hypothetical protein